jgi:multidrug resistance efflux pump
MADISAGKYLGGMTGNFDVNAQKEPLKGNQKASDAVNTAKGTNGAEIAILDATGKTTLHKVSVENGVFSKPKPSASGFITVDNLAPVGAKVDKSKPLAIDPNIAGKLGGETVLLIDEKNNTTVVGQDKKAVANKYLENPTASKVDAAYTVAGDDNHVNKKMASNVVNSLSANYRNLDSNSANIALLKEGQVKTGMNALIGELKTLSANTSQLEGQLKGRTDKFNSDMVKPTDRLNKANANWESANANEQTKVNNASENLREAKFPGVHKAENTVEVATKMLADGQGYLANAKQNVSTAQSKVNGLEALKTQGQNLIRENESLGMSNKQISLDMAGYLVSRKSELLSVKESLNNKAQYYDSLANLEDRKPVAPADSGFKTVSRDEAQKMAEKFSGGDGWVSKDDLTQNGFGDLANNTDLRSKVAGPDNKISTQEFADAILSGIVRVNSVTSDPFASKPATPPAGNSATSDPFASKPAGNSATSDPFASKPTGNKPSATSDPFAKPSGSSPAGSSSTSDPFSSNGTTKYKNEFAVRDFRGRASEIRSDVDVVNKRLASLDSVINQVKYNGLEGRGTRVAIDNMTNTYSYSSAGYSLQSDDKNYQYMTEQGADKAIIVANFVRPFDQNVAKMNDNERVINQNVAVYKRDIDGAVNNLRTAESRQSEAEANLNNAEGNLSQAKGDLQRINSSAPLPDSNPTVKSAINGLSAAKKNMDNVVGDNAPLTKEKNSAQGVVNQIKAEFETDRGYINGKIAANASSATQKINATKQNLGL